MNLQKFICTEPQGKSVLTLCVGNLSQGSIGLILMLDNNSFKSLGKICNFYGSLCRLIEVAPMVIGVSKMDLQSKPNLMCTESI